MQKQFVVAGYLALGLLFNSACNGGSDSSNGGAPQPTTPDQAIHLLNSQDQDTLAQWKSRLLKSCDALEIFTGNGNSTRGLDGTQFLLKTGNSLILKNSSNASVAVLGQASDVSGSGDTSYHRTFENNSDSYSVNASTHSSGGLCEVYLFGQKIYSTRILSNMQIVAQVDPASANNQKWVTASGNLGPYSNDRVGQLLNSGYGKTVSATLRPNKSVMNLIAQTLGLSMDDTQAFFSLSEGDVTGVLSFDQLGSTSPFAINEERTLGVIGLYDEVASIMNPNPHSETLDVAIPLDEVQYGDQSNSADPQLLRLSLEVQTKPNSTTSGALDYSVSSIRVLGAASYNDSAAIACFTKRLALLNSAKLTGSSPMLPSYDDVVGSCNQLSLDFDTAFLNSTDALAALNQKFRGVTGSSQMDYAGWDGALITYARALLSQKKDIQSVLDPSGAAPIIDQISQAANTIQGRLTVDLDLAKDPNMSGNLLQTALHWALSGQMASQDFLTQVLDTVNNTVAIFPSSTSSMIQALAQNPTGADNAATLAFARSISTEYKNTAASLVTAIAGLDEDNFVQSKIDSAIQQKYTLDQFKLWLTEANAAQSFAARDRARKTQDDVFFDSNLKSVIDRGLNEGWTETAYQGLEAIAPVSNYSEFCGNNKGSDSSLANCGSDFEYYSESSGKFLDPVFGGRYARASQNFQGFFQTLSDSSYFSDRSTLMDAFFQPLWSHCANSEFVNRLGSLTSLVNSLVGADPLQKFKIEDQIREVLSDCTPTSQ